MKILVINAGSSSMKYQLIDMSNEHVLAKGNCERIGMAGGIVTHVANGVENKEEVDFPTHAEAFMKLTELLSKGNNAVIANLDEISAIGHRVVQGAELFSHSTLVTPEVLSKLESISDLAPLHNPAHIIAIKACLQVFGEKVPEVLVFDTAFHQTIPPKAFIYPIPYEYYKKYAIRRYGFHGTSHRYVSQRLSELVNKPLSELKVVTCHLGNGSSITAVDHGKSVDTSMGFTPLDGIIMGTRCGGIDPSIIPFLQEKENLTSKQINDLMNKQSGYLGVSELSSDSRDLENAADNGNELAALALTIQRYQIKKYIGAYAAAMGGLDYVVFTGGIGENSIPVREEVCRDMEFLGIVFDNAANQTRGVDACISAANSKVGVWVVPTNEELLIARDTMEIIR